MSQPSPDSPVLPIVRISPEGERLLRDEEELSRAIAQFAFSGEGHKTRVPGTFLLGAGRYSFTFRFRDIVALKISTPYTSQDSFNAGKPLQAEDLAMQFDVLSALGEHLDGNAEDVSTPEQYFALETPEQLRMLGAEYMAGWTAIENRTRIEYGNVDDITDSDRTRLDSLISLYRDRIIRSIGGFGLAHHLNDLALNKDDGVHGGNILVPDDQPFDPFLPLCIIDQPAPHLKK